MHKLRNTQKHDRQQSGRHNMHTNMHECCQSIGLFFLYKNGKMYTRSVYRGCTCIVWKYAVLALCESMLYLHGYTTTLLHDKRRNLEKLKKFYNNSQNLHKTNKKKFRSRKIAGILSNRMCVFFLLWFPLIHNFSYILNSSFLRRIEYTREIEYKRER